MIKSLRVVAIALGPLFAAHTQAALALYDADFPSLYNNYRFSQANPLPWPGTYWPFAGHGHGSGIDAVPPGEQKSPAQKYDEFFATGGQAAAWEELHHTCTNIDRERANDCYSWYGHCNGWTGAALFNPEPSYDQVLTVSNPQTGVTMTFNYMDLKALLSESWLDAWVNFEGTGTTVEASDWIFDPKAAISTQPSGNNPNVSNYDAYWDVTPRTLFYALTNYLGVQKTGLAIDRFTGSEIWNQPVVGYRFLPITPVATPIVSGGHTLYAINMGVKIYWANDDVSINYKRTDSLNWNVADPKFSTDNIPSPPASESSQEHTQDGAILSRYLAFTLFFDAPVVLSADHTQVLSAGRMVGDGVWAHADPAASSTWFQYGIQQSQTHPDFIWRPEQLQSQASYRNPAIDPEKLYRYILQRAAPGSDH